MLDEKLCHTGKMIARTKNADEFLFELKKDGDFVLYLGEEKKEDAYKIKRLDLKPNFLVFLESGHYYQLSDYYKTLGKTRSLIEDVSMDPEILDFLLQQGKLYYSTEMAYQFELPENGAYDYYRNRGAYRKAKRNKQKNS